MTDEKLKRPNTVDISSYQPSDSAIIPKSGQSDIQVYKDVLGENFASAKTAKEWETLITLRERVQLLDIGDRRLEYAEKSADIKLKEDEQDKSFQRIQRIAASISSIIIGGIFIQTFPLAGLLFLILGLAKPLGYSLGDVSDLLNGLKGFPKGSNKVFIDEKEQDYSSGEMRDERF